MTSRESTHLAGNLESALDAAPSQKIFRRDVPKELLNKTHSTGLVVMVVQEWCMLFFLWLGMLYASWWLYPFISLLAAGRFHALGVILHDATHMPLRKKSLNIHIVEVFAGYPIATTLNAMRYHHLRHHRDSGMTTDPYYKGGQQNIFWWIINIVRGLAIIPFWTLRALVGGFSYFLPVFRNIYGHIFLQDRTEQDLRDSAEIIECARAEWGQIIFQTLIFLAAFEFPMAIFWGYLVPVSIAGLLAARRVLIEHNYKRVEDRKIETIIATTNDNHLDLLGTLLLAPRNIGYHIVHHIHPQVKLGSLPKLRQWYCKKHKSLYPLKAR